MIISQSPPPDLRNTAPECDPPISHRAGERLAISISAHETARKPRAQAKARAGSAHPGAGAATPGRSRDWLLDNARLLDTAEKQALEFVAGLRQFPVSSTQDGVEAPRVCLIAPWLSGSGGRTVFRGKLRRISGRISGASWRSKWARSGALKPALQQEILSRLDGGPPATWPELITSLRHVGETAWKELFEAASLVHRALAEDPAGAYPGWISRAGTIIGGWSAELAKHSPTERAGGCRGGGRHWRASAAGLSNGSRAAVRRSHVGYYLIDSGVPRLRERDGPPPAAASRGSRKLLLRYPDDVLSGRHGDIDFRHRRRDACGSRVARHPSSRRCSCCCFRRPRPPWIS